ncbi:hypothetical protein LC040_13140 [Bacillus tianshenii]|nr:hypothetical protein LC040_13140 [Bacillus tianshenii]
MRDYFIYDERLGIELPMLEEEWSAYTEQTQQTILSHWEKVRGKIPDRIADIEVIINRKQAALNIEEDFDTSCRLNSEISDLASVINDLWIWYRTNEDVTEKVHA